MSNVNRRQFIKLVSASAALGATPTALKAASCPAQTPSSKPHVVVVGGGFAGATAAKYIRMWSMGNIDVTLVERNANHISCILSNLVLNGRLKLSDITLAYDALQQQFGVNLRLNTSLDTNYGIQTVGGRKAVQLSDGCELLCDALVIAPGIGFETVAGLDFSLVPHAWIAGPQTTLLKTQLQNMPQKGTFVMTIPKAPYRCPPGPYERACVVADFLIRKKGGGKVVVLDANADYVVEKHTFETAFKGIYKNVVDYRTNVQLLSVDSATRTAVTSAGNFQGHVLNVLPTMKAAPLVDALGLNNIGGRWAGIDPATCESTAAGKEGCYIIGDSTGVPAPLPNTPKSGHHANAQAKVLADTLVRRLTGDPATVFAPERLENIRTNSACYSPITYDKASWLTAVYAYDSVNKAMKLVTDSFGESETPSKDNFETMFAWSRNLFADSFR